MILYSLPISNYCGKVLHALRFKDLECEILPPPGGYGSEEYKKRVPSGTIPALDHDGVILSESEVINEYLNEVFPEPNLLPGSAEQRAKIRMLCRLHDLKLEPIVRSLFPAMSPEKRDAEMVEKRLEEMEQSLERRRHPLGIGSDQRIPQRSFPGTQPPSRVCRTEGKDPHALQAA